MRAGTIILAAMILVWALLYFPHTDATGTPLPRADRGGRDEAANRLKELKEKGNPTDEEKAEMAKLEGLPDPRLNGEWKRNSYLGRRGAVPRTGRSGRSAGTGRSAWRRWRAFPAREVIVGTLGLIYDVGDVDAGAIGDDSADDEAKEKAAGLQVGGASRTGRGTRSAESTASRWPCR